MEKSRRVMVRRGKMVLLLNLSWVGKSRNTVSDQSFSGEEGGLHRNEKHRKEERLKGERNRLKGKNNA